MDQTPLRWQADEYVHYEKTSDWYWMVGIISVSIAIVAIVLNNILFAILVLLGTFTLTLFASRKPDTINVEVNHKGVVINDAHYPYAGLESFWVEEHEVPAKILLKSQKKVAPLIVIPIEEYDSDVVREYLHYHLEEEELFEPILQKLIEHLGF